MENDIIEKLTAIFSRFGNIAVDMGFVTAEQLKEAITEQVGCGVTVNRESSIALELFMYLVIQFICPFRVKAF